MKKLKVVTIVGTRPEIIRLSILIPKLDEHTDHVLVHTGQNYDRQLNDVFFEDLGLRQPDHFMNVDTTSFGTVMGDTLKKSEEIFFREKPDAVMILGDTNSSIAAVVAERMHIPVYHMEAGNRSFDNNVPEELNRRMVDHVATFNLPYTEHARRNLLAEGIHPRFISKTGSPIGEISKHYSDKIESSKILQLFDFKANGYFLASIHRQENVDRPERLGLVLNCLFAIREHWGLPVLVSTHPRTRARLESQKITNFDGIIFHEPFGYFDYNNLQKNAFCVVSDSGTISEESSIGGFSAVALRDSIERPEALETGSTVLSGLDSSNLVNSIQLVTARPKSILMPTEYEVSNFSDRVLYFLISTARQYSFWSNLRL